MRKAPGIRSLGTKPPFTKGGSSTGVSASGGRLGGGDKSGGVSLDSALSKKGYPTKDADALPRHSSSHQAGQRGSAKGNSNKAAAY